MTKEEIDALVEARISEGRTIDYKEKIGNLGTEEVKLDLLKDVASFANTAGGRIFFGISERRDEANRQTGDPEEAVGLSDFNSDAEVSRIENILSTGIEPRFGITTEVVDGFPDGPVLILHIPLSWAGPHMVRDGRFYARDNTGKKPMDYHMIRNSFVSFLSLNEAVRTFHRERIREIFEDKTPRPIEPGARLVIHALPVSAFVPATRTLISISELQKHAQLVSFGDVYRGRANLDGWLVPHKSEMGTEECVQMFRNGVLERVHTGFAAREGRERWVNGNVVNSTLRRGIQGFLDTLRSLRMEPPIIVMVAFKGLAGHRLSYYFPGYRLQSWRPMPGEFDRDEFVLPEVVCERLDSPSDDLIQELLDIFWQAGGAEATPADVV
jgi:Putative DNA-binding domain